MPGTVHGTQTVLFKVPATSITSIIIITIPSSSLSLLSPSLSLPLILNLFHLSSRMTLHSLLMYKGGAMSICITHPLGPSLLHEASLMSTVKDCRKPTGVPDCHVCVCVLVLFSLAANYKTPQVPSPCSPSYCLYIPSSAAVSPSGFLGDTAYSIGDQTGNTQAPEKVLGLPTPVFPAPIICLITYVPS